MPKRRPKDPPPAPPALPKGPLRPGDWVEIAGARGPGQIMELDPKKHRARVDLNGRMITAGLEKLSRTAAPPPKPPSSLVQVIGRAAMAYEIDLHGMRVEEAIEAADRALDQAVTSRLETFRIIHGHGTGALRKAIRELLSNHPHVADYRFGEPHEGGLACTIAILKRR